MSSISGAVDAITDDYYRDTALGGLELVLVIVLRFLALYLNFSGYTSIAIGLAALFGLRVRENFNFPLISRNPQEFWTRWHLSLGRFINEYLYMRMLVIFRRPYLVLLGAFLAVGLWHNISAGYLIWGLGHGGAIIVFLHLRRRYAGEGWVSASPYRELLLFFGWALTMANVSLMSYIANAPDIWTVISLMSRLV